MDPRAQQGLEPRSLSQWGTLGQTFAIGPIFAAGFLAGTVAVFAGFNTPLAVLVAGVGALALAYVLTLYARRFAGAGAVYEYLGRGVHPALGTVGAGIYVMGLLFLGAGGGFVAEGYLANQLLAGELAIDLGWWVWALVALAVAIGVNWIGVRIGIVAIVATAAVSVIPYLVIAVAILAEGPHTLAVFDPGQTSWSAVFHGVLFAIALFIGFETVAALGEEATAPRRSIPVAMLASIAVCLGFYLLITYAAAIGFGRAALEQNAWFASGNPIGELGTHYVGPAMGWIVNLTIVLDLLSVCIAFTLAASRVLMALARDGRLPAALSRTSRRHRTPVGGLAVIALWALLVIAWTAVMDFDEPGGTPDVLQAVLILSATGTYLVTLVYLLLAVGGLRLLQGRRARIPVVLVAIAVPILSFYGSLDPFPDPPNDLAVFFAAGTVLVTLVWGGIGSVRDAAGA